MSASTDFWQEDTSVLLTSFWGWDPETWGTVGFTGDQGMARRNNLLAQLSDPFITIGYVTSTKTVADPALKGMIAGFYLVSHETGDRDEFTHPINFYNSPEKWRHSLRALRAFSYLPETRLSAREFDPDIIRRARSISAMGTILTDPDQISRLRESPWLEVDVFTPSTVQVSVSSTEDTSKGMVAAGPANSKGYVVSSGTQFLPRELYVLRLEGDTEAYLGRPAPGLRIFKIGLSVSPDMRRQTFQKNMPRGAFNWKIERTTRAAGGTPYSSHAIAVKGEDAMKRHLAANAEWLGGEFYLASNAIIEAAWQAGLEAAN